MTAFTWKYLLYAQYPACLLLAIYFFINYLFARKSSAVKSVLWVLLFGVMLALSVLFTFLGVQQDYWSLKTLLTLKAASWIGVALVIVAIIAHFVHLVDKKHTQKVMEKELEKAARDKDNAVAQAREEGAEAVRIAHEEGRRAAQQEAAEARYSQAAEVAGAEAAASGLASEVNSPIDLTLEPTPEGGFAQDVPAQELTEPGFALTEPPAEEVAAPDSSEQQ